MTHSVTTQPGWPDRHPISAHVPHAHVPLGMSSVESVVLATSRIATRVLDLVPPVTAIFKHVKCQAVESLRIVSSPVHVTVITAHFRQIIMYVRRYIRTQHSVSTIGEPQHRAIQAVVYVTEQTTVHPKERPLTQRISTTAAVSRAVKPTGSQVLDQSTNRSNAPKT